MINIIIKWLLVIIFFGLLFLYTTFYVYFRFPKYKIGQLVTYNNNKFKITNRFYNYYHNMYVYKCLSLIDNIEYSALQIMIKPYKQKIYLKDFEEII
jgi:hypothetical protein